ncbi:DNA invertase Pin-like site-specific DNA recombinase [Methylobacterium sp. RAS18]|nr:DNA invertase Pin-like site-specific DNA recombinase [Methylobacterium sp. RAS18]
MMPDVPGYARASTNDRDLEGQRRRLPQEAGAIHLFDDIVSGKSFDRPVLIEMLSFCQAGDTICVVCLDRLGRSLKEHLETIDLFKARGLAFRSLEERLDTSSAAGELVFHVFGAIAYLERRLIVERTCDGIVAARARGKVPGRPPLDSDKLASALKLIVAGIRPVQAAKQFGLGRSTLYRQKAAIRRTLPNRPTHWGLA